MSSGDVDECIKLCIRVRPVSKREEKEGVERCIAVERSRKSLVLEDSKHGPAKTFSFDNVADESVTQEEMFNLVGRPICDWCMEGYNGTVFAYGQTGSGKTHTMQGPSEGRLAGDDSRGLIPRIFECLFDMIQTSESKSSKQFFCKASFLEIYNEMVYDLLDKNPQAAPLSMREQKDGSVAVKNLNEKVVTSPAEAYHILETGSANRMVASTAMNRESSRSHSVFSLVIIMKDGCTTKESRLNLVDLAGSERQKDAKTSGDRLKEANNINKSLAALGKVIKQLVEHTNGRDRHIQYRDSKLTFLLKDSLGGNTRTVIVANISPSTMCFGETLSTLSFAQRAKQIKNAAHINEDMDTNVPALQAEVARLREELDAARAALAAPAVPAVVIDPEREAGLIEAHNLASQAVAELQLQVQQLQRQARHEHDTAKRVNAHNFELMTNLENAMRDVDKSYEDNMFLHKQLAEQEAAYRQDMDALSGRIRELEVEAQTEGEKYEVELRKLHAAHLQTVNEKKTVESSLRALEEHVRMSRTRIGGVEGEVRKIELPHAPAHDQHTQAEVDALRDAIAEWQTRAEKAEMQAKKYKTMVRAADDKENAILEPELDGSETRVIHDVAAQWHAKGAAALQQTDEAIAKFMQSFPHGSALTAIPS